MTFYINTKLYSTVKKKEKKAYQIHLNEPIIPLIFTWRVNLYPYFFLNESKSLQWPYLPSSLVMDVYKERLFTRMNSRGRRGLDRMVVGFTTTYAITVVPITTDAVSSKQ